ncbi:hypothetical protein Q9Z39_004190 [Enterobacter hormaechei]
MNITADFTPDFNNASNNQFRNTTPVSGFCARWASYCRGNGFPYSINLPLRSDRQFPIYARHSQRDGIFFKFPSTTAVKVQNENGEVHTLNFTFRGFSATAWENAAQNSFNYGALLYGGQTPTGGRCGSTGLAMANPAAKWYAFAWRWNGGVSCAKVSTSNRTGRNHIQFTDQSILYELTTPNPLVMSDGLYKGSVTFNVGPGSDIDYGDNYQASDSELTINFSLKVTHDLKVSPVLATSDVNLYPCYYGAKCSREDAEKNWERWMVTNIPPQSMTGLSSFNISSSGSFTVYLNCGNNAPLTIDSCPILSNKSGSVVPVKAFLSLPDNISDKNGMRVTRTPLYTQRNVSRDRYITQTPGLTKQGYIDFIIEKKNVIEMLKTRPDSWSGNVTIIFDPNLY